MCMEAVTSFLFGFAILWTLLGFILFTWIYDQRILNFFKKCLRWTKKALILTTQTAAVLALFLIPLVIAIFFQIFV